MSHTCCVVASWWGVGLVWLVPGFTKAPGTVSHRAESRTELIISFLNALGLNVSSCLKNMHVGSMYVFWSSCVLQSWNLILAPNNFSFKSLFVRVCSFSVCDPHPAVLIFLRLITKVATKRKCTYVNVEHLHTHTHTHLQAEGGGFHCILRDLPVFERGRGGRLCRKQECRK